MNSPTLEQVLELVDALSPEDRRKVVEHIQMQPEIDDEDDEWEAPALRKTLAKYMTPEGHLDYDKMDAAR